MDISQYDIITQRYLKQCGQLLDYVPNNQTLLRMHKSDTKVRLILGGKRSGKTTFGVVEVCWAALGIHPYLDLPKPPLAIRVCSVDFTSGIQAIIMPMIKQWLPAHCIKEERKEKREIELVNGTIIDFKSYDQDIEKFEGVARHLVWMDEEPPRDIYESNYMRTIGKNINGKLLITCTPLHGLTWLYDVLYDNSEAVPPYVEHCHVSIFDNPHLPADAVSNIMHDPAMKDNLEAALFGKFIAKTGLIYKQFAEVNICDPYTPKAEDMILIGIDPHDRNPHAVVFAALNREEDYIIYDEVLEHLVIGDLVNKIKTKMGTRFPPALAVIDTSAHAEQSIAGISVADEMMRRGLPTIGAFKDWQAGVLKVNEFLDSSAGRPRLKIARNCPQTIREFRHYVWADWARAKDKYNPKEKPLEKDDHLLDAIRYVVMANVKYRPPGFKLERKDVRTSKVTGYY